MGASPSYKGLLKRVQWLLLLTALVDGLSGRLSVAEAQARMKLRQEVLKTWTTEQGLPQDFVTAIQQTPDGFLWIGTNGGLARFDGLHFRTFLRDGPPALRHRITDLAVGDDGTLWIATSAGLFTYKDASFRSVSLGQGSSAPIEQLLRSAANRSILIRTKDHLYRANNGAVALVDLPLDLQKVVDCAETQDGQLWFADGDQVSGVRQHRVVELFRLPNARLLYTAPDGRLIAGDGHHLFHLTQSGFVPMPRRGVEEFVSILIDHEGSLWMASGGLQGISRFALGEAEMLDTHSGLASNDARVLFEDHAGDLWIGTISGLQCLHRGTFISSTGRDGLPAGNSQYDAIFEDHAGSIWVGTLESGVFHTVGDRWRNYGTKQGVRRGQVRGFADDGLLPVLALSDYGLFASKDGRYQKLPGIPPGYISSPLRMEDGSLWFSVLHRGVFRLQKDGNLSSYGSAEGLTDNLVWALVHGEGASIWAASKSGAFHFDGSRWSLAYPTSSAVDSIFVAHDGGIYLGTTNGLLYHGRAGNWALTQENGLPGDTVFSLAEDPRGDLWLGTARGICRIPRAQLDALSAGGKNVTPELLTEDDGLRSRTVLPIGQVTALRAHDGRIWFATASGPAVAEPAPETPQPHAVLDDITVDDEHFPAGPLTVKPGRHRLVFTFTAPSFIAPEQLHFRYRLLGWDSAWVNADSVREASYVGLAPGKYRFQVQALSRTGEPGSISDTSSIYLKPFFWQTRLFLVLLVAFLAALVVEVTRRRTLKQAENLNLRFQERAAERERLASHLHDTFIQDLTGTALQLELLGLQLEEDPVLARHSLSSLAARMREMIGRSRDIVSNLHSMAGMHYSLPDLLGNIEAEFRLGESPAFVLRIEGEPCLLHPFLRDEVYSICREAVANAFRHALANEITVRVEFLAGRLKVEVSDDGIGMSDDLRTQGRTGHFGLSGMQAHARRIDAKLTLLSAPGVGTQIILETPLRVAAPPWTRLRSLLQGLRTPVEHDIFDHHA